MNYARPLIPLLLSMAVPTHAAIALDRTRVIFDGSEKSTSLSVSNQNKQLPFLAQGWIEDASGNKIQSPLTVLPPVQRIEPGGKSQVKIQGLPAMAALPQDRESLFYFNLREIPPRSTKPNSLQIALQTRIKLFYRPKALSVKPGSVWQEKLTLTRVGNSYQVNNPTPYYVTVVSAGRSVTDSAPEEFEPVMVAPKSSATLNVSNDRLGNSPVLTYINDYGGRPKLQFNCSGDSCTATAVKEK